MAGRVLSIGIAIPGVHLNTLRVVLADDTPHFVTQSAQHLVGHFKLWLKSAMGGKH
jgi:hypothetical protein